MPVSATANLFTRLDANYVGSSYSEFRPTNVYRRKVDEYTLVNGRAGVEFEDVDFGVYVFVNNIFDKVAINREVQFSWPGTNFASSSPPRTIGINVRKGF